MKRGKHRGRPARTAPEKNGAATHPHLTPILALSESDVASRCEAYVVLVETPQGQYRRRVFLSLHSASLAVERAHAKGQFARMVLCKLSPISQAAWVQSGAAS